MVGQVSCFQRRKSETTRWPMIELNRPCPAQGIRAPRLPPQIDHPNHDTTLEMGYRNMLYSATHLSTSYQEKLLLIKAQTIERSVFS